MASSQSQSASGSTNAPTVVQVIAHNRSQRVWQHWDLVEMSDGTHKARCKYCGSLLGAASNSTLDKHITKKFCPVLKNATESDQADMGSGGEIFIYSVDAVQDRMAKFVIQNCLPFNHFDNPKLTALIRETLQPRYTHVSRMTLRRHCLKLWRNAKKDLIVFFQNLQTGVNLTSDVWSAPHGCIESYLCVTAHWVDPDSWQMMKRTISFDLFPVPHTGDDLFELLDDVIQTYGLQNKIFSIALDNASNNTGAVDKLMVKYKPICAGDFFHSRCVAHIINLVVKDGLNSPLCEAYIYKFKCMIYSVFKHKKTICQDYKQFCKDTESPYLGANWDTPHRWNSTCEMFESALKQRDGLKVFHSSLVSAGLAQPFEDACWKNIKKFVQFLDVFKKSTTALSGVYYPTSCLVLYELYLMTLNIKNYENKKFYMEMIPAMKEKFKKYFLELPSIFTVAAALNPFYNVTGVECLIQEIFDNLDIHLDTPNHATDAKTKFNHDFQRLFDVYHIRYGPTTGTTFSPSGGGASSSKPMKDPKKTILNVVRESIAKKQKGSAPSSELGRYSGTDYTSTMSADDIESFDILGWWRGREAEFPVLSAMARDLLSSQASTVASESAFSTSGRVISLRRTRLSPEAVETCICLKDHLDAVDRIQDQTNLEDDIEPESKIHDEEVEEGRSSGISDEELREDAIRRGKK